VSKKKSKKKSSLKSKVRENAKLIVVVIILIGVSFYIGIATPQTISIPINLSSLMTAGLQYSTTVTYGPFHTGVRVTFEVTSNSHSWDVNIIGTGGTPLTALSSSDTGTFSTAWHYAPNGVIIQIHSDTTFPTSMNLDGTLSITSSRFPFI
jgi:hypothetical protein